LGTERVSCTPHALSVRATVVAWQSEAPASAMTFEGRAMQRLSLTATVRCLVPSLARWRVSVLLVSGVLIVGLTSTYGLVLAVESQQRDHVADVMEQRVHVVESAVTAEVQRYVETAASLAAAVGAQSDLSADDFVALTATLATARLPGVSGAAFVVPVTDRQMPRVQSYWRAHGSDMLRLSPASTDGEHLFVVLSVSLDGLPTSEGRDLRAAVEPTEALLAARSGQLTTASSTYVLLKDRQQSVDDRQLSFVIAAPIYAGIGTPDRGLFRGWLVLGMRATDFLGATLKAASQDTVAATLQDASTSAAEPVQVAEVSAAPVLQDAELRRDVGIEVAGRNWELQVTPTTEFSSLVGPSLKVPAGALGVLFTVLLAALVGTLSTSRDRALTRVGKATADLRADIDRREQVEARLREREAQLNRMALTDSLTGLANHRAFMDQLDRAHSRALRHGTELHVLFGDVDRFKTINDTYGHAVGDSILRQVADRLRHHSRAEDTIGRLGGDEFAIICENVTADTQAMTGRLSELLAMPYTVGDHLIAASVSVGLATPTQGESSAQLLARADTTMYQAKAAHRSS
jgi:diguanylate cyclase (GGDEF)-like protein